ncbi:MAG: presqualene diphosphate synthase HpnD [Xanthobacteraceae bacterium]|nr:presqualene diphosphate synthase HpnD [Xanthobacteraceae bacterium]
MSMETPNPNDAAPAEKRASGSSFYTAMRILPQAQRDAMFEIYSFCRAVDDIADSTGRREQRVRELAIWRNDIAAIYAGHAPPALQGLAQAVQRFGLKREDFLAVIDGMEMDVVADIRAPDFPTLEIYCDRVACAVGRLSVKVFGLPDGAGVALADQLGRALQLTNILRDLDEDAALGRLYLPADALRDAGITTTDPLVAIADPRIEWACHSLVALARAHFTKAEQIMAHCPRRSVRAPRLMRAVYQTILERLVARGFGAPRTPIRIGKPLLVWMLMRYAII